MSYIMFSNSWLSQIYIFSNMISLIVLSGVLFISKKWKQIVFYDFVADIKISRWYVYSENSVLILVVLCSCSIHWSIHIFQKNYLEVYRFESWGGSIIPTYTLGHQVCCLLGGNFFNFIAFWPLQQTHSVYWSISYCIEFSFFILINKISYIYLIIGLTCVAKLLHAKVLFVIITWYTVLILILLEYPTIWSW